jgi:hypothetical protein
MLQLLVALAQPANASRCLCDAERARFDAFAQKLADAPTLDEAQDKALGKIALTRKAVALADRPLHGDPAIAEATEKLDALDVQVPSATSPQQVALAFSQLNQSAKITCSYSTTEILIIIIGFLLFVLPGIILLILFC